MGEETRERETVRGGRRYRLTLSYCGGAYSGWQRQPNALTVQEILETALSELTGERVVVTGAGRTDAGVHARGQVVHFDLARDFAPSGLVHGTNYFLPADVRVLAAAPAPPRFHARFSAVAKEYRYRLVRARVVPPRWTPFAVSVREALDLERLAAATLYLPGRHDFAAFARSGGAHTTTVRTVHRAAWADEPPFLELAIVGDGFLRGMVRGLVGTLLEVAEGKRDVATFARLLAGAGRDAAGPTAPAHGLTLENVDYLETRPRARRAVVTSLE